MKHAKVALSLGLLLLLPLLLGSCLQKNIEGRRAISFMPDSYINGQSATAYQEQKKTIPLSKDARLTAINQRVGNRIIAAAQKLYPEACRGFEWEVNLFDEPKTVNAYCMPGGKIGIYTGILPVCQNEAALAAVMGHEVGHALLKHGNERVSQQVLAAAGVAGLGIALDLKKPEMQAQTKQVIIGLAGATTQVGVLLPFSRAHESEADRNGLRLMAAAGYDPSEGANLWRRMSASGGKAPPRLLSTHPANSDRIANLEALRAEVQPLYQGSAKYGLGEKL